MNLKRIRTFIIIIGVLFLITGCTRAGTASSWPGISISDGIGFLSYGNQSYAIDLANGGLIWKYPAEVNRARQLYAAPAVGDDIVVVGDYDGVLTGLNKTNGTSNWDFNGAGDRYIASALVLDGMTYAPNTDRYLYALDNDGNLVWKFIAEGPNWTKPVSDGKDIYFASMDHKFYALEKNYALNDLTQAKDGSKTLVAEASWTIDLGMAVVCNPILDEGIVYIGTIEGSLFAIDLENQTVLWEFNNDGSLGAIWGTPVVADNSIFIADVKGNIYSVDKEDGSALWPSPFNAGGRVVGGGTGIEEGILFATDEGKLFVINSDKEPKTITNFETPIYTPLNANGELIITAPVSEEALLTAIDLKGFKTWSFLPVE